MNKMHLAEEYLPQNVGRPQSRTDFDLPIGSHVYHHVRQTPTGSVWQTSLRNNLMGFIFATILWPVIIYFATADLGFAELALWLKVILGIVSVVGVAATLLVTGMIFYRRKLIIDHQAKELRFCRWTDKPYYILSLEDIRGLSFENIQHLTSSDSEEHQIATTQVLVAETHDGRIASIAFSPAAGLFEAITGWTRDDMWGPNDGTSPENSAEQYPAADDLSARLRIDVPQSAAANQRRPASQL